MAASPVTVRATETSDSSHALWWSNVHQEAIPAEAVNRIAERGSAYKTPSVGYDWDADEMVPGEMWVWFDGYLSFADVNEANDYVNSYRPLMVEDGSRTVPIVVPEGYKSVSVLVEKAFHYEDDFDAESLYSWWSMRAENSRDWIGDSSGAYSFTVDCNGTEYTECWAEVFPTDMGVDMVTMVVPQQYDGDLTYTVYGAKLENGEAVKDEMSYITLYLQGGSGSAAQPVVSAADPQPTEPAADPQQPADPTADPQPVATQPQGTTYVTKSGDSLMKIAKELDGDKNLWTTIYELNRDLIKNPNVIYANMQLQLP